MTLVGYLAGVATLSVIVISLALGAVSIRRRWLIGWTGAPARLAEAILFLAVLTVLCEVLGSAGLLRRLLLLLAAAAVGTALVVITKLSRDSQPTPAAAVVAPTQAVPHPGWAAPAVKLIVALVSVQWLGYVRDAYRAGIMSVDSLHYHLPFAARFAQSGNVSQLNFLWLDPVWSFYPNNAELLHAVGMVAFGRDVVSPLINLLWLSIAFLAAWVLGRPFGFGHLAVGVTALVFASPFTALTQSGSALNDTPAIALFLASLAILAQGDRRHAAVAVAGLAAGLAIGTKVTTIAPLIAVTVVLVALTRPERRSLITVVWTGAIAAGGGFWFLRNLVRTGSPMPAISIPGLPSPRLPAVEAYGFSVAHYIADGHFWRAVVPDGFRQVFGATYPVLLLLAGVGIALGVAALIQWPRPCLRQHVEDASTLDAATVRPLTWTLLIAGIVAAGAYVVTPVTAYGPPGNPFLFGANLRYAFPSLLAGLLLVGLATFGRRPAWALALTGIVMGALAVELGTGYRQLVSPLSSRPWWFVGVVFLWAAGWALARRGRLPGWGKRPAVGLTALALVAIAAGYPIADSYLQRRYTENAVWAWARGVRRARIAVVGYPTQYPLAGLDLSNRVDYLGKRGSGGSFRSYRRCEEFRSALRAGNYDYLVAGSAKWELESAPEQRWERDDPLASTILDLGRDDAGDARSKRLSTIVFRIRSSAALGTVDCE